MIYGNGIDLASIPEFLSAWQEPGTSFFKRFYTEGELEYCRNKGEKQIGGHLAARYAAKEAFIKALDGQRFFKPAAIQVDYRDIEVKNDEHGRPYFKIHNDLADYVNKEGICRMLLSLSHVEDYAIAQVILET